MKHEADIIVYFTIRTTILVLVIIFKTLLSFTWPFFRDRLEIPKLHFIQSTGQVVWTAHYLHLQSPRPMP